jgi:tRNA(Ile)-lysidine synthase
LVQRVERTIVEKRLLNDGDAALVSVSGGIDSMVLLRVLNALRSKHRWKLVVAHFNHQLRGKEADGDERFVGRVAKGMGLRFESDREDVKEFARLRKISIEMAARRLRHDFLARTARALGIANVALAHHADDQVELFFVRLFRGAGTQGLGGMEWSAPSPADWNITLLRPLLGERKPALADFAREKNISFREDATNKSTDILRNRIRRELLPRLRRDYQSQIDRAVLRSMELMHDEGDFVTLEAIAWFDKKRAGRFDQLHVALQRRIVQMQLLRLGIVPEFGHVEALRTRTNSWVTVRAGMVCRRKPLGEVEARPAQTPSFQTEEATIDLESRVKLAVFESLQLSWRIVRGAKLPAQRDQKTEFFDALAVGRRVVLRHWREGDRFQPIGMATAVKLQDLFVNKKIPREQRHELIVAAADAGEIFWVEGLRIGESFKVTPGTHWTLKWEWKR